MATDAFKTPSRPRSRATKAPPHEHAAADRAHPWTASRCQRLLRPLLSRLALLRRELASRPLPAPATSAPTAAPEAGAAPAAKRAPAEDGAFLPPRKKLRHTYSRRWADRPASRGIYGEGDDADDSARRPAEGARFKAARDLQRDDATGEVVAFTPLLRRARGHHVSSPVRASGPSAARAVQQQQPPPPPPLSGTTTTTTAARRRRGPATGHGDLELRLALLRDRAASPAVFASYDAIYHSLEALLDAAGPEVPARTGASSLLDMCLAKMPQYIEGVQAWEVFEAEKRGTKSTTTGSDVSLRMYSELESLGTSGTGWTPLRAVARADALAVIRGAMAEELFADEFSMLLVDLCARHAEARELNGILEVLVSRQYPEPLNAQSVFAAAVFQPLSYLRDFATRTDRSHLLLQHYSSLLVQGLLPHTWLATSEFEHIWALAYRMISRGEASLDAVDFLATSVTLLSIYQRSSRKHLPQDAKSDIYLACRQTFVRALSILSAMRRSGEGAVQAGTNSQTGLQKVTRIGRSIDFTLHACIAEIGSWRGRRGKPRDLLSLAVFLSSPLPRGGRVDAAVTRAFEMAYGGRPDGRGAFTSSKQQHIDDTIISLISSVARICPRGTAEASRDYLQGILAQLGRLGLPEAVLQDITRAGAFALARQTNDLRDLLYAEQLVSSSLTSDGDDGGNSSSTHASQRQRRTYFDGYRWDETISEWVTASPTVQRKIPRRRSTASVPTRGASGRPGGVARSGTSFRALSTGPASSTSVVADTPARQQGLGAGSTAETSGRIPHKPTGPAADKRGRIVMSRACSSRQLGLRGRAPAVQGVARRQPGRRAATRLCDELADHNNNSGGECGHDDEADDKENSAAVVVRRRAATTTRKRHSAGPALPTTSAKAQPPAGRRRRVVLRLSIGEAAASHSDDELAM